MAKQKSSTPSGVNKGIQQGMQPEDFRGRVICKKCGKDIEFTLESELFQKCPRCKNKVERCLDAEGQEAKKIIKFDLLRRSKKYLLHIAIFIVSLAIAYNITGFFAGLFAENLWWLGLLSLPLVAVSYIFARVGMKKSAAKRYKVLGWIAVGLNLVALALIVVTAVPYINERLMALYGR